MTIIGIKVVISSNSLNESLLNIEVRAEKLRGCKVVRQLLLFTELPQKNKQKGHFVTEETFQDLCHEEDFSIMEGTVLSCSG